MENLQSYWIEAIYSTVDGKLAELLDTENPWKLCTSVGVDNTSVNIGIHNSLKTRVLLRNSASLRSYCEFCDQQYRSVIKHVSTRWLSLEIAIERSLKQYPSLR